MKKKQTQKLDMFGKIYAFMEKNAGKLNALPELKQTYDQFVNNFKTVSQQRKKAENNLNPFKNNRKKQRTALIDKTSPVAALLAVYSSDTGDKKLRKISNQAGAKADQLKDTELIKTSRKMLKKAKKLMDQSVQIIQKGGGKQDKNKKKAPAAPPLPGDYGITPGMLDEMEKTLLGFSDAVKKEKQIRSEKKKFTGKIKKTMKENQKILKNRLDKLMVVFQTKEPELYREYTGIRSGKTVQEEKTVQAKKTGQTKKTAPGKKRPVGRPPKKVSTRQTATRRKATAARKTGTRKTTSATPTKKKAPTPGSNPASSSG